MPNLIDPQLEKTLSHDKVALEKSKIPTITVSASYKEDVKGMFGYPEDETLPDVVFSRAHFSMAMGVLVKAWGDKIDPKKAWMADPTNYVSHKDWNSIELTELIGKTLARQPLLKKLKDLVDQFGRSKLPILGSITTPLLYLTENIDQPILSFHIATGNILAEQGKTVVQMITDPHVRDEYLNNADKKNFYLMVFDENTKTEALEKAGILGKKVNPDRIIVTGPPIDPRIIQAQDKKRPWRSGKLNIAITTGGLGTNKTEIRQLLRQLLPELRKRPSNFKLLVYAGTHLDIFKMVEKMAAEERVKLSPAADKNADFRILYHPQIVDANELLIKYGFPWADGFITKPSGDMAYDAVASGSFILTLAEWGEWEHNIREIFEQAGVSRKSQNDEIVSQLMALMKTQGKNSSWIETAMRQATQMESPFFDGAKNILKTYREIAK